MPENSFFPLAAGVAAEILSRHPDVAGEHSLPVILLAAKVSGGSPGRSLALLPALAEERETWLALLTRLAPARR